jgi:hypothetical protein
LVAFDTGLQTLIKSLEQYMRTDRTARTHADPVEGALMLSFVARIEQAQAELAKRDADPLRDKVAAIVRGVDAISTAALLDLIGLPKTTGNGRRISPAMRALGFVPIKSRRLMPGGYRDTVTRGWARPLRANTLNADDASAEE